MPAMRGPAPVRTSSRRSAVGGVPRAVARTFPWHVSRVTGNRAVAMRTVRVPDSVARTAEYVVRTPYRPQPAGTSRSRATASARRSAPRDVDVGEQAGVPVREGAGARGVEGVEDVSPVHRGGRRRPAAAVGTGCRDLAADASSPDRAAGTAARNGARVGRGGDVGDRHASLSCPQRADGSEQHCEDRAERQQHRPAARRTAPAGDHRSRPDTHEPGRRRRCPQARVVRRAAGQDAAAAPAQPP